MPDLSKSVQVVKAAVDNLVKVSHETCSTSLDDLLRTDMPQALERVNQASTLLIDAAHILKQESSSIKGRQMLIQGARCKTYKSWTNKLNISDLSRYFTRYISTSSDI
jgi:hypothetical protein